MCPVHCDYRQIIPPHKRDCENWVTEHPLVVGQVGDVRPSHPPQFFLFSQPSANAKPFPAAV